MHRPRDYATSVRVPMPDDDDIRRVIGSSYDAARTLNVIKMMAGSGDMYSALTGMVSAIFSTSGIAPPNREVIILRAACLLDVPYEWQANEQMARNAGLSDAQIHAISAESKVTALSGEQNGLCDSTDEMLRNGTLSDTQLTWMLSSFGAELTRKYIVTIGWFSLLSLFLNATRVPLEITDKIGDSTSPI